MKDWENEVFTVSKYYPEANYRFQGEKVLEEWRNLVGSTFSEPQTTLAGNYTEGLLRSLQLFHYRWRSQIKYPIFENSNILPSNINMSERFTLTTLVRSKHNELFPHLFWWTLSCFFCGIRFRDVLLHHKNTWFLFHWHFSSFTWDRVFFFSFLLSS